MDATDAQTACFEAGIKFGALYHQFAGTPVGPESAASLERAIEESIENQPHCESVDVDIRTDRIEAEMGRGSGSGNERDSAEGERTTAPGYTELTGRFMEVEIVVEADGVEVVARMEMEDGYPLMRIESVRG